MKRTIVMTAAAVLFAGTAQAAVTEFIIYKQPDFRGASHVVKGEVNNLEGGFAGEGSSLIVRGGFWQVCTRTHFQGDCHVLAEGEYPRLGADLDDRIVAVRFLGHDPRVARHEVRDPDREARRLARQERQYGDRYADRYAQGTVDLYGRPGFRGRSLRIEERVPSLWERRFDGRASSMIVHDGRWQVCTEPRFEGRCRVYGPGEYPTLGGLDDRISSLRPVG